MGALWSAAQLPMLRGAAGFATLIATRVLLGFAEGPAAPVAVHHVHGWFEQRERTLPTVILTVGAAAGVAVAAPTLGAVISHFGWRWAFGAAGLAGLLWAAVWKVEGREGPLAPPVGRDVRSTEGISGVADVPLRAVFLSGTFITAALGAFAAYWVMSAKLTWLPDYLQTVVAGTSTRQPPSVGEPWPGYENGWLVTAALLLVTGVLAALFIRPERDARRLGVPETPGAVDPVVH